MRIAVVQFTCAVDAACTEVSRRSVGRMAERHGLDVEWMPIVREGGRGLHLNGVEAVAEELELFAGLRGYDDWVLKLDSDTLWLGASFLDRLGGPWLLIGGGDRICPKGRDPYPYVRGHGYLVRPRAFEHLPTSLDELAALLEGVDLFCGGYPSRPEMPALAWPEDEAITGIIRYCWGESAVLGLPMTGPTPFVGYYPFSRVGLSCSRPTVREMSARFDLLEFGRWGKYRPDVQDRAERRQEFSAVAMERFFEQLD